MKQLLTVSSAIGTIKPGQTVSTTVKTRWWERLWFRLRHPWTPAPATKLKDLGVIVGSGPGGFGFEMKSKP